MCALTVAIMYEPRKGQVFLNRSPLISKLQKAAKPAIAKTYKFEKKMDIREHAKKPEFHLTHAVRAWCAGETFDNLARHTTEDEGGIVRSFRMTIQLLREIMAAPGCSESLAARCRAGIYLFNRDVVDAYKQLSVE